jgi:hypothetical protein
VSVYKRCGCRDERGKQYNKRCPKLADPKHGHWTYRFGAGSEIDPKSGQKKHRQISPADGRSFTTKKAALDAEAAERAKFARGAYVKPSERG